MVSAESNLALHGTFLGWQRAGLCDMGHSQGANRPEQVRVCGHQEEPLLMAVGKSFQVSEEES